MKSTQTCYSHKSSENNDNAVTTNAVFFMCPELSYNHHASTENVPEKSVSQWRPAVKAEGGALACVRLLSRGV